MNTSINETILTACVGTKFGVADQINRMYDECQTHQELRELYHNSKQAGATVVRFGPSPSGIASQRLLMQCADNGKGFTVEAKTGPDGKKTPSTMHQFAKFSEPEDRSKGTNFGVGAKVSLAPWNQYGIVVCTRNPDNIVNPDDPNDKGDVMFVFLKGYDGSYGLVGFEVEDEDGNVVLAEYVRPGMYRGVDFTNALDSIPRTSRNIVPTSGTVITLMGGPENPITLAGSPKVTELYKTFSKQIEAGYEWLNLRYENFDGCEVGIAELVSPATAEELLKSDPADNKVWRNRNCSGYAPGTTKYEESYVGQGEMSVPYGIDDESDGTPVGHAKVRWALLEPNTKLTRHRKSMISFIIDGEAVESRLSLTAARAWGVPFSFTRFFSAYIEFEPGTVVMDSARSTLKMKTGARLPYDEIAEWFSTNHPAELDAFYNAETEKHAIHDEPDRYAESMIDKYRRLFTGWSARNPHLAKNKNEKMGSPDGSMIEKQKSGNEPSEGPFPNGPRDPNKEPNPNPDKTRAKTESDEGHRLSSKGNVAVFPVNRVGDVVNVTFTDKVLVGTDDEPVWGFYDKKKNWLELSTAWPHFKALIEEYEAEVEGPADRIAVVNAAIRKVYREHAIYRLTHKIRIEGTAAQVALDNQPGLIIDLTFYGAMPERRAIQQELSRKGRYRLKN